MIEFLSFPSLSVDVIGAGLRYVVVLFKDVSFITHETGKFIDDSPPSYILSYLLCALAKWGIDFGPVCLCVCGGTSHRLES